MAEVEKPRRRPHSGIPTRDADIISIAEVVSGTWEDHPEMPLVWLTPAQLIKAVQIFQSSYRGQKESKGNRFILTKSMNALNKEINVSSRYVKHYLIEKYTEKGAMAFYPQFGMIKSNKTYRLPLDQDRRMQALDMMIDACTQHGLEEKTYGTAYWTNIQERFADTKKNAVTTDSSTAENVGIKKTQRALICKALNALIHIIKGNYPDTWKEELRVWGFQKEKY